MGNRLVRRELSLLETYHLMGTPQSSVGSAGLGIGGTALTGLPFSGPATPLIAGLGSFLGGHTQREMTPLGFNALIGSGTPGNGPPGTFTVANQANLPVEGTQGYAQNLEERFGGNQALQGIAPGTQAHLLPGSLQKQLYQSVVPFPMQPRYTGSDHPEKLPMIGNFGGSQSPFSDFYKTRQQAPFPKAGMPGRRLS